MKQSITLAALIDLYLAERKDRVTVTTSASTFYEP